MAKTVDKRQKNRRFRDILANSGLEMESGEVRDIPNLYVMSYGGELINVNDLAKDPEKQTESYAVKAQADHGEEKDGVLVPTVEKQFGSCRVWTEKDGLHARVYFANDDALADHLFAISDDASYSIGTEWAEPGLEWNGKVYDEAIGILREISMVLTGNDPRARTTDHKAKVRGSEGATEAYGNKENKEKEMGKTTNDALTPDERAAMMRRINEAVDEVIDDFTTSAPESQTEPTARDNAEAEGDTKTEDKPLEKEPATREKKDSKTLHMPITVVHKVDGVRQEVAQAKDWLTSDSAYHAFARTLKQAGKMGAAFDSLWRNELQKHINLDGITGLPTPSDTVTMFRSALEKPDGIIGHFEFINGHRVNIDIADVVAGSEELARAGGHKPGDKKVDQELGMTNREIAALMVYKRLALNAIDLWENPKLIDFRARELVDAIIREIERAAIRGDGRTAPAGGAADRRMFCDGRGFTSIKADAAATTGFGALAASTYTQVTGDNAYDTIIKARSLIRTEGRQFIVAKNSWVTTALTARLGNDYLVQPGTTLEDLFRVMRVYTPQWMDDDTNDAYLVVDKAYKMVGDDTVNAHTDFDTSTNENILLDETPRGGALGEYKSAVAIAPVAAARASSK